MKLFNITFAVLAVTGVALADHQLALQPDSRIWVAGGSTVRDWKCTARTIDAVVMAPSAETQKLDVSDFVKTAEIDVPVAQLECGNGRMNDHLRSALKDKQFPNIDFKLDSYTVTGPDISIKGELSIAGKTLPVTFAGKVSDEAGTVRATASKQVKMSEWGVKPPTLMLGALKVRDEITIGFDVAFKR